MTLVAIIADTHYGARSDNLNVLDHFNMFFSEVFFPTLDRMGVKHIIHCGDLVDRRKFINYNTATELHKNFTQQIIDRGITCDVIIGNHDAHHKNSNNINSLQILYGDKYESLGIRHFAKPTKVTRSGKNLLYLPWICEDSKQQSYDCIRNYSNTCEYVFGHLELSGFEMYRGHVADEGIAGNVFAEYKHVFTGHYHHRSTIDNITYVGAPYEIMWSDYNDDRGFEILDLNSGQRNYIKNPHNLFHRIVYDETDLKTFKTKMTNYKRSYVKVVAVNKTNQKLFEEFIDSLEKVDPIDIQIVDETIANTTTGVEIDVSQTQDTLTILNKYVDNINVQVEKDRVKRCLIQLYNEACESDKE